MCAAHLQAHLLQDAGHAVPDGWGGGQGQIHDAEGHAQPGTGLPGHQLAHAGHLEGGLFDELRHHVEGLALHALEGVVDHAGAGHPHVDDPLRLAHAVERPGHEGVVLHRVAEHHQLGAAEAAPVGGALGAGLDGLPHEGHRVHVDARLGGAYVDGRAHHVGDGQRLGYGGDELFVPLGHALVHQGGEATDEVHPHRLGRLVHGGGEGHVVAGAGRPGHQGHGGDGYALVDDGYAELRLNVLAGFYQLFRRGGDLVVDLPAGGVGVRVAAVQQAHAHGDGAHIQVLVVDHPDGL